MYSGGNVDALVSEVSESGQNESKDEGSEPPGNMGQNPITSFITKHFPGSTFDNWTDWRWQIRNRITTVGRLQEFIDLTPCEAEVYNHQSGLPLSITPYYIRLMENSHHDHPIRRMVVPTSAETIVSPGESLDPLCEESQSPLPGLVHRYPDRVLFLTTNFCSTYCRYCTRSRVVGRHGGQAESNWPAIFDYIREHKEVRDVLLSGGDPLTMETSLLEYLLSSLRKIPHVEIIRIGTKVPAVLPQRITNELISMLSRYHPIFLSLHFSHPLELTNETQSACESLANHGLPLGSQTVLLKGINDDLLTMKCLFHGLLRIRVKPYYLYQCDPLIGSMNFRTKVSKGLKIIDGLRGHTSGYAIPTYVIDAPGGGGKIPVDGIHATQSDDGFVNLRNYLGGMYQYPDLAD